MKHRTKSNYARAPKACPKCGRETINDETTWVTSALRVHSDTMMMLCEVARDG